MSTRILVHAPALNRRRPMHARRASVAEEVPVEYSTDQQPPRWLVVGTGILGLITFAMFIVGLVVIA
ncbi:MAG TPA: hypothetical protein VIP82_20840 [Microbacterium sp.]|uniref:hypothetical protein n=1 Tax=Microbacterium sp. TaxID=51671 RepID=UPI002F93D9B9